MKGTVIGFRIAKAGGPEVLERFEAPLVEYVKPFFGKGDVVIRNAFAGVNFIDTYRRTGLYPPPYAYPCVLGGEGSGEVVAVGEGVDASLVGTKVAYFANKSGSYATHSVAQATSVFPVPDGVEATDAAAALLQGCTAHYLSHSCYEVGPKSTVVVHAAAGGTGLVLAQMCKLKGATVIGTCRGDAKRDLALSIGKCDHVIDYAANENWDAAVKEIAPDGVDAVFDGVGKDTFAKSLLVLRRRGSMVSFGNASGAVPAIAPLELTKHRSISLQRPKLDDYADPNGEIQGRVADLFGWIKDGSVKLTVGKVFPLEQVADSHKALEGRETTGKVVLDMSGLAEATNA